MYHGYVILFRIFSRNFHLKIKVAQNMPICPSFFIKYCFYIGVSNITSQNKYFFLNIYQRFQWYVHPIYLFISKLYGCPTVATVALVLQTSNKPATKLQQTSNKLPTSLQSSFQHSVPFHPPYKTLLHGPWSIYLFINTPDVPPLLTPLH